MNQVYSGIDMDARPRIASLFRLQWEAVQNSWVLLYPEGMVKLNGSAGEILKRLDGQTSVQAAMAAYVAAVKAGQFPDNTLHAW